MTQQGSMLASKPDDLGSKPRVHIMEREKQLLKAEAYIEPLDKCKKYFFHHTWTGLEI